jgi:hypothetical protein
MSSVMALKEVFDCDMLITEIERQKYETLFLKRTSVAKNREIPESSKIRCKYIYTLTSYQPYKIV